MKIMQLQYITFIKASLKNGDRYRTHTSRRNIASRSNKKDPPGLAGEYFYEASCVSNLDFNLGWVPSMYEARSRMQIEVPFYMY